MEKTAEIKTTTDAVNKYIQIWGQPNEKAGFNLKAYYKSGTIVVELWYSRNDFHCEKESIAVFMKDGRIIKDGKLYKQT